VISWHVGRKKDRLPPTEQSTARRVIQRTRGHTHGPITRLASPGDLGQLIKPFVFLDYFDIDPQRSPRIGFHPHSGIATITVILEGQISYEETSGTSGIIDPGGVEWMKAGGGVWHNGGATGSERVKGFQLWIALPAEMEMTDAQAIYLDASHFRRQGPARVVLGRYGAAASELPAPATINYLDVVLKRGEQWRYEPPRQHNVAWIAVHEGKVAAPEIVQAGELAVFEESNAALDFVADDDAGFVLGSAVKHPFDLVLGNYSVHTSQDTLRRGEANIAEIADRLRPQGKS
jgi:redox-sensitive bicupin YhaK (pirin superfamily)